MEKKYILKYIMLKRKLNVKEVYMAREHVEQI